MSTTSTRSRRGEARSLGAPLTLRCACRHNDTEFTLFVGDTELAERLVEAINKAAERPLTAEEARTAANEATDRAVEASMRYAYGRYR